MLEVLESVGWVTVQDGGRFGWRRFGVPPSGPMDWFAHRAANRLVGNPPQAAALEIGFGEVTLLAHRHLVLAATGVGYRVSTALWTFPLWTSFVVRAGETVRIDRTGWGNWAYLAVAGGLETEMLLGSRAAYGRAGLGAPLTGGDRLPVGRPSASLDELAARTLSAQSLLPYSPSICVDVIPGPHQNVFTAEGRRAFFESPYALIEPSDRTGYRLQGIAVERADRNELPSEGMAPGSVQVPADGQPIVLMADGGTTGGYPVIAVVARADLPLLAQLPLNAGAVRFRATTVDAAQARYRALLHVLDNAIQIEENPHRLAQ